MRRFEKNAHGMHVANSLHRAAGFVFSETTPFSSPAMRPLFRALLLLSVVYVAGYALIVEPSSIPEVRINGNPPWKRTPHYKVAGGFIQTVFQPALEVDRMLFPERWQFPPPKTR